MSVRFASLAFFAAATLSVPAAKLDGIAAYVDSHVITVGDVMNEIRRNPAIREQAAGADVSEMKAMYMAALDSLICRRLVLKAAAEKKVEIPEWVVDNQIREIVHEAFGGDMNKLEEELQRTKTPMSEYRATILEDITARGMRQQIVDRNVTPSPSAMRKEFETNRDKYRTEDKVSVRVILLKPGSAEAGLPGIETRWAQIGEELAAGKTFADMAVQYSADSHAKDGGLWKDVKPEAAFRPEIAEIIAKLKVGEVSRMTVLDGWGFVVKKESESVAHDMTFAEAYHLIERNLRMQASAKAYDEWLERLRNEAFVKVMPPPEE